LRHSRDTVLAFAAALDADLATLAAAQAVPVSLLRALLAVEAMDPRQPRRWAREAALQAHLRGRYHALRTAVAALADGVVRASSSVENVNSRLRGYFQLWRQVGHGTLTLLQFYFNHRRLPRSRRAERVGHSPAELLTGQPHPHWLELLGYQRFCRTAAHRAPEGTAGLPETGHF
jgi:hypothetical protein